MPPQNPSGTRNTSTPSCAGSAPGRSRRPPACGAYCDFLLRTAALGDLAELAAALLPCMWGYAEIAARLPVPTHALYARWIAEYASPEFAALAGWCRELVDELAERADRDRMRAAFERSSALELGFWDMAWRAR